METFSALLAICAGNSPVSGEFPAQRQVTRSFHVSFDLHLNKLLSKQSWCWWFETPSRPLWRQCNVTTVTLSVAHERDVHFCWTFRPMSYIHSCRRICYFELHCTMLLSETGHVLKSGVVTDWLTTLTANSDIDVVFNAEIFVFHWLVPGLLHWLYSDYDCDRCGLNTKLYSHIFKR